MQTSTNFVGLYRTLGVSLVIPLIVIQVLLHLGVTPLIALAAAAMFPLAETIYEAVSVKRVGLIAIVSLVGLVAGFGLSFATGNAIFALLKDSLLTGVFGLLFLGSLLTSRPLIYRLNLDLAGTNPAALAAAEALWERPAARRSFQLITIVWGLGLLLDAVARVVAVTTLPIASATS
ncbi:MAG TPA: VC0807 family protein, partial [Candidatus Acidoferrum sp.]|nr:VC0807 family protein [Candidatus Acidoferrum sp.]